ncbi:hypothetical protein J6590_015842 [Homalodisca vitripennis]|nr:hypothetical protein J6590_015842 [Homalodisca vitripennis]
MSTAFEVLNDALVHGLNYKGVTFGERYMTEILPEDVKIHIIKLRAGTSRNARRQTGKAGPGRSQWAGISCNARRQTEKARVSWVGPVAVGGCITQCAEADRKSQSEPGWAGRSRRVYHAMRGGRPKKPE